MDDQAAYCYQLKMCCKHVSENCEQRNGRINVELPGEMYLQISLCWCSSPNTRLDFAIAYMRSDVHVPTFHTSKQNHFPLTRHCERQRDFHLAYLPAGFYIFALAMISCTCMERSPFIHTERTRSRRRREADVPAFSAEKHAGIGSGDTVREDLFLI